MGSLRWRESGQDYTLQPTRRGDVGMVMGGIENPWEQRIDEGSESQGKGLSVCCLSVSLTTNRECIVSSSKSTFPLSQPKMNTIGALFYNTLSLLSF